MITKRNFAGDDCSVLGFGCMRFPCNSDGTINEAETFKMLDAAYNSGVNYYDTAYPYHNGTSELVVGKWLKKIPRDSVKIATKLPLWAINDRDDAPRIFNEQLNKLGVDYVDYYLLHAVGRDRWENTVLKLDLIPIFEQLQREGKIRHFGFSFHDNYQLFEEMLNYRKWDFCQIQYNYMDTHHQAGDRGYELAEKLGVPLVIMEPIRGGSLVSFSDEVKERFSALDHNRSMANWALSWVGTHENAKVILSGMSTMEQVEENISTFSPIKPLSKYEMTEVSNIVKYIESRVKNKCTKCRYCMPCPFGVNIPKNFEKWNEFGMYDKVRGGYKLDEWTADKCRNCRACVSKCPQEIPIPEHLAQMLIDFGINKS